MTLDHSSKKTFFITGASRGLGLAIALHALEQGHRVIGTARDVAATSSRVPEFERLGGSWVELDVSQSSTTKTVSEVMLAEGDADWVVISNAGYALQGVVEDSSESQIQEYTNVMLYGLVRVLKAAVPIFRNQMKGCLIDMSSVLGFVAMPECGLYSAIKAATESIMEGYASLLAPWNIRCVTLLPGTFRTDLAINSVYTDGQTEDYVKRLEPWYGFVKGQAEKGDLSEGDPKKLAERVLEIVEIRGLGERYSGLEWKGKLIRVLLGSDTYGWWGAKLQELQKTYSISEEVALSTKVDA